MQYFPEHSRGWQPLSPGVQVRTLGVVIGPVIEGKEAAGFIVFPKPVSHFTVCCRITVNSILLSPAEYLEQVDLEEEKDTQEERAMQELNGGDGEAQSVPRLLEKLSGPDRLPSYYRGGLELLTQALAGCEWPLAEEMQFCFFVFFIIFSALLSPLHCFTYFTPLWLNGPSDAKVK